MCQKEALRELLFHSPWILTFLIIGIPILTIGENSQELQVFLKILLGTLRKIKLNEIMFTDISSEAFLYVRPECVCRNSFHPPCLVWTISFCDLSHWTTPRAM